MPSCVEWNVAIVRYVTVGVPRGTSVFLNIDDRAIDRIWSDLLHQEAPAEPRDALADFVAAVRAVCVLERARGDAVNLCALKGTEGGVPRCVAFLAAMVLAEYRRMGEEMED